MGRLIKDGPVNANEGGERPLLALAMIVRNEEQALPACLDSVKGLVDEIVIIDTGSTDRTVAMAQEFGARVGTFEWCDDFAAARNAALDLVTALWVLHLDADEELEAPNDLRAKLQRVPDATWAVEVPVVSMSAPGDRRRDLASFQKRLFRSAPHIRFERPIHEEIVNPSGGIRNRWTNITVWHSGYIDETVRRAKIETRNRPILERAYDDDPTNPVYALQLAILQPDAVGALAYYEKVRSRADRITRKSELFHMATVRMVERFRDAGRLADAINLATEVFVDDPTPDITVLLGQLLILVGELERAAAVLKLGLGLPADTTSRFLTGSSSWLPLLALGEIARRQGRFADAASYVKKAIALHPSPEVVTPRLAVLHGLALQWRQAATALGERETGDTTGLLARAARRAYDANDLEASLDALAAVRGVRKDAEDALLLAELLGRIGDATGAQRVLKEASAEHPDHFNTWLALAELETGPAGITAALDAARRATDLHPDRGDAWAVRAERELFVRDNQRSAESASRALAIDANDERATLVRIRALTRLGEFQEAYDLAYAAASAHNESSVYVRALSDVLDQAGEADEALTVLSNALDQHPADPELYTHVGNLLGKMGRYEDALNAFELAITHGAKPSVLNDAMKFVTQAARRAGVEPVSPVRSVFQA